MSSWCRIVLGVTGIILMMASSAVMFYVGSKQAIFLIMLGFLLFAASCLISLLSSRVWLNKFWLAGLLVIYPSFIALQVATARNDGRLMWIASVVAIFACWLCWKGQLLYEAKVVRSQKTHEDE